MTSRRCVGPEDHGREHGAQISEGKVLGALTATLRQLVEQPRYFNLVLERFTDTFQRLFSAHLKTKTEPPPDDLDTAIRRQQKVVDNLVDALAAVRASPAVTARLRDEEAKLQGSKRAGRRPWPCGGFVRLARPRPPPTSSGPCSTISRGCLPGTRTSPTRSFGRGSRRSS